MMVSVIMITYNHEKYIREAINGVLNQKCSFEIELIIADDKSPDNTEGIVQDIIQNHKNGARIKYTKHRINKGMNSNFFWAVEQCRGKYVAICEGDDYWTDLLKIQKQIEFMDGNPQYAMTFHNTSMLQGNKFNLQTAFSKVEDRDYSQKELFTNWIVATASMVLKKEVFQHPTYVLINSKKDLMFSDNLLVMVSFLSGKVKGMEENMAVYRKHSEGVSYNVDRMFIHKLNKQNILFGKYFPALEAAIPTIITKRYLTHLKIAMKSYNVRDSIYFLIKFIKAKAFEIY